MPQPYQIFTIYAREDAQYLTELLGHLKPLERAGRIKVWSDREINPGVEWEKEIVQKLDTADIILILVSSAYYNSAYIHEVELNFALKRHEKGEARVLPVIVRPCSFGDDPIVSRLQVLPSEGKPVTDKRCWPERDDAWLDVVNGVRRTVGVLQKAEQDREQAVQQAAERERLAVLAAEQEAERKRQAENREQEKIETERRAAERRAVEEQDRHKLEAEKARREQEKREHEAQNKDAYRRAEQVAWQNAIDSNNIAAYDSYFLQYPHGEHSYDARARIKQLKRENAAPFPLIRYAVIGGSLLALLLAVWLVPKLFGRKNQDTLTDNISSPVDTTLFTAADSIRPALDSTAIAAYDRPVDTDPKPAISFNYPMVRVARGTFVMGSPANEEGRYDDECQHSVTIGSFSIGKYEVTQAQWQAIMRNNPSDHKGCDDCPVEQVSWNDIQQFIKKLNAATGKRYRLPTEAEWEFAARGGNDSRNYLFAGSNTLGNVAWYNGNSGHKTHSVGGKSPNELGLFDMSGNVWEWCQDAYKPYPCEDKTEAGSHRVARGGSCFYVARGCRAAGRDRNSPGDGDDYLGFRLASSAF